ncbi:unnamed protein product [Heterobilharzia americana]|nr:unnamed protein product [Heterobilharzia americana]
MYNYANMSKSYLQQQRIYNLKPIYTGHVYRNVMHHISIVFWGNMNNKVEDLHKRFKELDKNNDGKVTYEEFEQELLDQGYPQCLATAFMRKFDLNRDGYITLEEFVKTLSCTDDDNKKG